MLLNVLVRTTLRGEHMSNLCWLVFAAVDSLIKEWYNLDVRLSVYLSVPALCFRKI